MRTEVGRLSRFALVGGLATLVHLQISLAALTVFDSTLHAANLCGFGVALGVSYLGHYHVSFHSTQAHRIAGLRFGGAALLAYLGNVLVVATLSGATPLPREVCLFAGVGVMPLINFILSRFWVYV